MHPTHWPWMAAVALAAAPEAPAAYRIVSLETTTTVVAPGDALGLVVATAGTGNGCVRQDMAPGQQNAV